MARVRYSIVCTGGSLQRCLGLGIELKCHRRRHQPRKELLDIAPLLLE